MIREVSNIKGMGTRMRVGMMLLSGAGGTGALFKHVFPAPKSSSSSSSYSFHFAPLKAARRSPGSSSSSGASRAQSRKPFPNQPSRPSGRKADSSKRVTKLNKNTGQDAEEEEITRAKEILGVVNVEEGAPKIVEADGDADRNTKKNAFEEWLDNKLATGELAQRSDSGDWVQVDKAKRKFYEKRRQRMYGTDSEDERPQEDKYVELKPEIVEFKSFHAKQEELYFYDAFCFPWEKDHHYRLIRKLEQKYYPDQGLENALIDPNQPLKPPETPHTNKPRQERVSKSTKEAESEADPKSPRKTRVSDDVPIFADEKERKQHIQSSEANDKEDACSKRILAGSAKHTVQVDLASENSGQGLSQKKVHQFLKSLKHTPHFDGPADMPYLLMRKSELPARWDGPLGTMVLVDKPKGWTSFTVCGKLRRLVKVEKVGHAGTLDPMATGLLIVCVGKATKQVQSFQDMIKVYSGVFRLGEATSTWDADSPVVEREPWEHIKDDDIQKVVTSFVGEIWQVPPMFSAIKVGGEKMYDKARRGETIDLPPRRVLIYDFDVERSLDDRQNLIFRVTCSKGTYVRSLCADFGRALGSCAHLTSLRRDRIGDYSVADAWKFSQLEDEIVKHYI